MSLSILVAETSWADLNLHGLTCFGSINLFVRKTINDTINKDKCDTTSVKNLTFHVVFENFSKIFQIGIGILQKIKLT